MMYPYLTLNDETEIVHSEMNSDGYVKVYIEKPVYGGFHHATCYLPDYRWENIYGFSAEEMQFYKAIIIQNFRFQYYVVSCVQSKPTALKLSNSG